MQSTQAARSNVCQMACGNYKTHLQQQQQQQCDIETMVSALKMGRSLKHSIILSDMQLHHERPYIRH